MSSVLSFSGGRQGFNRAKVLWTNLRLCLITNSRRMIVPLQSELPLRVAVCAWCNPKKRGVELGAGLGAISHGICPRHLKMLRLELQKKKDAGHLAHALAAHSRRRRTTSNHPELNYQV
jgi:hypothetical protein